MNRAFGDIGMALRRLQGFMVLVGSRFVRHTAPQHAAALTYTSLLSLVPLMTVALAIFSAFPVADRVFQRIQDFVFQNFVPTFGEILQQYLAEFIAKASHLTGPGAVFLLVLALLMMANIDRALNAIWEVRRTRSPASKFLIYWAVLSLGPILIGLSVLVTSYVISLPILSEATSTGLARRLLGLAPVAASAVAFTLLYAVVPNRRVVFAHALAGGVFAALLFELAKRGFALYVTQFPTYEAIYGALATVPIFLVWLYVSWIVVLLGAEVAHCLGIYRWRDGNETCCEVGMGDAVALLLALDEVTAAGEAPSTAALAGRKGRWTEATLEDLLGRLRDLNWVHLTREGGWVLARHLDAATLAELVTGGRFALPSDGDPDWPVDDRLANVLRDANAALEHALGVPLAAFRAIDAGPVSLAQRKHGGGADKTAG